MRSPRPQGSQRRLGAASSVRNRRHRASITELSQGQQWLREAVIHRMLAELRLDLKTSSTAHRPDRTASTHAQNATFDI